MSHRPDPLLELQDQAAVELAELAASPGRDLWPSIAGRIASRRRARRRRLAARGAGLCVAILAAATVLLRPSLEPSRIAEERRQIAVSNEITVLRGQLESALAGSTMPASARVSIEDALTVLGSERADLDRALAERPDDLALRLLRNDCDAREAALLHRLHRLALRV